jgi:hypothetical protein
MIRVGDYVRHRSAVLIHGWVVEEILPAGSVGVFVDGFYAVKRMGYIDGSPQPLQGNYTGSELLVLDAVTALALASIGGA